MKILPIAGALLALTLAACATDGTDEYDPPVNTETPPALAARSTLTWQRGTVTDSYGDERDVDCAGPITLCAPLTRASALLVEPDGAGTRVTFDAGAVRAVATGSGLLRVSGAWGVSLPKLQDTIGERQPLLIVRTEFGWRGTVTWHIEGDPDNAGDDLDVRFAFTATEVVP